MANTTSTYSAAEGPASLSTSASAIDLLVEPLGGYPVGGNATSATLAPPPSSNVVQLLSSRVSAVGDGAPLLVSMRSGHGRGLSKNPTQRSRVSNDADTLTADASRGQGGGCAAGDDGWRCNTGCEVPLTATRESEPPFSPSTAVGSNSEVHPPIVCQPPPASLPKPQPFQKHLKMISLHSSKARRLPDKIFGAHNGGGGGIGGAIKNPPTTATDTSAAAHASEKDSTPALFSTSHWVESTLKGGATRSVLGAQAGSLSTLHPSRLLRSKELSVRQTAAQLHEQRVAAAVQSQREMREFTTIMHRIEASGGSNAVRQQQQRRRHHARDSAAAPADTSDAQGDGHPRSRRRRHRHRHRQDAADTENGTISRTLGGSLLDTSPTDRSSRGRGSEGSDEDQADGTDSLATLSRVSGFENDDDGGASFAAASAQTLPRKGAGPVQVKQLGGHNQEASVLGPGAAPQQLTAARLEALASENAAHMPLYQVREKTARGWVELHRKRVDLARAGPPMLQRQVQVSKQRLLRAYRDVPVEEWGEDVCAQIHRGNICTLPAAVPSKSEGVARKGSGAYVHFKKSSDKDLSMPTISWGGIPEDLSAEGAPNKGGDDVNDDSQNPLGMVHLSPDKRPDTHPPREDDNEGSPTGGPRSTSRSSTSGTVDSRCGDTDPHCVGAEALDEPMRSLHRVDSLPAPSLPFSIPKCDILHSVDDGRSTSSPSPFAARDAVGLRTARDNTTPLSMPNEEQYLRNELQRLLIEAHESNLEGLRGGRSGCSLRRRHRTTTTSARGTDGGDLNARGAPVTETLDRCLQAETAKSFSQQSVAQVTHGQPRLARGSSLQTAGSSTAVLPSAGDKSASLSPFHGFPSPKVPRSQDGAPYGGELANSMSTLSATTGAPLVPLGLFATNMATAATATMQSRSGLMQSLSPLDSAMGAAVAAPSAASAVTPHRSCRRRPVNNLLRPKKPRRHKPLPAVIGVGERSAALLDYEVYLTRQWELEADQAHNRDIECTCALLQRLRPLREQLMDRDLGLVTPPTRTAPSDVAALPGPLLLTRGSEVETPLAGRPDMAAVVTTVSPNQASVASVGCAAAASMMEPSAPVFLDQEADITITRSHLPQAVLSYHRQLIYEEAVRLDAADRIQARIAYVEVLAQLARKNVSSVSWPAVSALLCEAHDRLRLESQQAMGVPVPTGGSAAGLGNTPQATAVAKISAKPSNTSCSTSSTGRSSAFLQTVKALSPRSKSAQQYGGLQQLIATHLGVLELSQWQVQEVLQHLAALFRAPPLLLQEWISEQQRYYSRSYNYEERLNAIDHIVSESTMAAEALAQLTLHCCRRPPVESSQKSGRIAPREVKRQRSGIHLQQQSGEEHALFYIRVRSAVQSVSSTAVPLSSTEESPLSGSTAAKVKGAAAHSDNPKVTTTRPSSDRHKSPATVLNFLRQTLTVPLTYSSVGVAGRLQEQRQRGVVKGTPGRRSDAGGDSEIGVGASESVLHVELMQVGVTTPLAAGKLRLGSFGFNAQRSNRGELHAHTVQVALRRRGYRSGELAATLEI